MIAGDATKNMKTDDTIKDCKMISQGKSFMLEYKGGEEDRDTDGFHSQEGEANEDVDTAGSATFRTYCLIGNRAIFLDFRVDMTDKES